jgi:crotonobetainyl-CoA:carnitine CoA-transferase CaiB-like acyl-CoA transferase
VLGAPEITDARFVDDTGRMANHSAVIAALEPRRNGCTTAAWTSVPIGIALSIASMHAHPQMGARKMVTEFERLIDQYLMAVAAGAASAGNP